MKKNIINLLFVSSFLFTGCSEIKKEDTLNKTNQSNKLEGENLHSWIFLRGEINSPLLFYII